MRARRACSAGFLLVQRGPCAGVWESARHGGGPAGAARLSLRSSPRAGGRTCPARCSHPRDTARLASRRQFQWSAAARSFRPTIRGTPTFPTIRSTRVSDAIHRGPSRKSAPRLRTGSTLRHPVQHRAEHAEEGAGAFPLRIAEQPGTVSDSAQTRKSKAAGMPRGDRHVLVLQQGKCKLYEMWDAYPLHDGKALARRLRRAFPSRLEQVAAQRLDFGRCRGLADSARARQMRGGAGRRDRARAARHVQPDARRLHPSGDSLCERQPRQDAPADGAAHPHEGVIRYLAHHRARRTSSPWR